MRLRCPICQRTMDALEPAQWPEAPFCSRRCRLIDLGRWLGEDYRIAADTDEDEEPLEPDNPDESP
jgi:endogenous inhibitor of DNA gyrase (YacG/DUF329 family)